MANYLVGDDKQYTKSEIRWAEEGLGSRDDYYFYRNEAEELLRNPTGFHNCSVEDYIEVTEMIYEVGRKWRQFWSVQRACDKMPDSLVGTDENRVVCCEPRAWWIQRWLATVAHWGFAVKRWVQRKKVRRIQPSTEREIVKELASTEVVDVLPAKEESK